MLFRLASEPIVHLVAPTLPTVFPIPLFRCQAPQPNHTVGYSLTPCSTFRKQSCPLPPVFIYPSPIHPKSGVRMPHAKYCLLSLEAFFPLQTPWRFTCISLTYMLWMIYKQTSFLLRDCNFLRTRSIFIQNHIF